MHLACLGVTKRIMQFWLKGSVNVRLSSAFIMDISSVLLDIRKFIPAEFCRLPRSLNDTEYFKASEYRTFLLYTGVITLKNKLCKKMYNNFLCLCVAIRILVSTNLSNELIEYAVKLLQNFLKKLHKLYMEVNMSPSTFIIYCICQM